MLQHERNRYQTWTLLRQMDIMKLPAKITWVDEMFFHSMLQTANEFVPLCNLNALVHHSSRPTLEEQITVRIVQTMIQATDLAHILYGGHYSRKKTRVTQNFNMAPIFHDGHHGISWIGIFVLEMAVNGQKRLLWQQSVCFWHAKCTVNVINTIQMFRLFQYGRQFPRWPPSGIV